MSLQYSPHSLWHTGFTEHIFPEDSRPFLNLVASIGLCLFLFLIGLEIDSNVIKRNARLSITVAFAGEHYFIYLHVLSTLTRAF